MEGRHLLLMQLCLTAVATASLATPAASAPGTVACGFYKRGPTDVSVLDCRLAEIDYEAAGYTVERKILVLVPGAADTPSAWTLSPPLAGDETINSLPTGAFAQLADAVNWTTDNGLSLRRLHQPELDLAALESLTGVRHLELAETNATCLRRYLFAGSFGGRLRSLRLSENADLACIQPGSLDPLTQLVQLIIVGSPRLKTLGEAPALPSLVSFTLLPGGAATAAVAGYPGRRTFCRVGGSLRSLWLESKDLLEMRLTLLPSLAGLETLRAEPPSGETMEATVQRLVAHLQTAFCAVWPGGGLRLNGAPLNAWVADQLSIDYAELCDTASSEAEASAMGYTDEVARLCRQANATTTGDVDNNDDEESLCSEACPPPATPPPPTKAELLKPTASSVAEGSDKAAARREPGRDESKDNWERQSVIGTMLLTSGAFLGGVLLAAYCLHSRWRLAAAARLKLVGATAAAAAAAVSAAASSTTIERGEQEPIRLIGYAGLSDGGARVVFKEDNVGGEATEKSSDGKAVAKWKGEEEEDEGNLLTAEL